MRDINHLQTQIASIRQAFAAGDEKVIVQPQDGLWLAVDREGWVCTEYCDSTYTAVIKVKAPKAKGPVNA